MLLLLMSSALGRDRILWYEGNVGYTSAVTTAFTTALTGVGIAGVDRTTSWPTTFSPYAMIVVAGPALSFTAPQVADLQQLIADGGLVVLLGDNATGFGGRNNIINGIASSLGVGMQIAGGSYDPNCWQVGVPATVGHPFLEGLSSISYAYTSSLSLGSNSVPLLTRATASDVILAYESGVLLSGDVSIFASPSCDNTVNSAFFENLWTGWCDFDGDGVARDICGGTDCDDTDATAWVGVTVYADADGDGYGDGAASGSACGPGSGWVSNTDDCDDADAAAWTGAVELCDYRDNDCDGQADEGAAFSLWYADGDSDGFGSPTTTIEDCESLPPAGYVQTGTDCDDSDASSSPVATERCDGRDQDCDGAVDNNPTDGQSWYLDVDGDGFGDPAQVESACSLPIGHVALDSDCDDRDATIYPGASERCDGLDQDCDGSTDEQAVDGSPWYADFDGDGWGDPYSSTVSCTAPSGYAADPLDCDDTSADVSPEGTESCDGRDEDCDGSIDEQVAAAPLWYLDADGDGWGGSRISLRACSLPSGYAATSSDCDDGDPGISPGAAEICNGRDDDCDGSTDPGSAVDATVWYVDGDGDGYGDPATAQSSCRAPTGMIAVGEDCADADASISPAALESCDGLDNNCDGLVDQGVDGSGFWYLDADGDGYGSAADFLEICDQPVGYVGNSEDCDDAASERSPGQVELPYDGVDQDCDGADLDDVDADGVAYPLDCADEIPEIHPGAAEVSDGLDNNCDGLVDEGTASADDDADGYTEQAGDCDDQDPGLRPGATELPNSLDEDCDGLVDEGTVLYDDDGDGYTEQTGDCNDGDATVSPGRPEQAGTGVDEDCDGVVDSGVQDEDGDGYTSAGGDCSPLDGSRYPGAPEQIDGLDNNCDGRVDEGTAAVDDDGDGQSEEDGDCNDQEAAVFPGASEQANGRDDDCDGVVDEDTPRHDDDGDGFTEEGGDCDDSIFDVNPASIEVLDGLDQDCDGLVDEGLGDSDGDGYRTEQGDCNDADGWIFPGATEHCDGLDNDCDGELDPACGEEDSGPEKDPTCGCALGAEPSALLTLGLAGLLVRRRRR